TGGATEPQRPVDGAPGAVDRALELEAALVRVRRAAARPGDGGKQAVVASLRLAGSDEDEGAGAEVDDGDAIAGAERGRGLAAVDSAAARPTGRRLHDVAARRWLAALVADQRRLLVADQREQRHARERRALPRVAAQRAARAGARLQLGERRGGNAEARAQRVVPAVVVEVVEQRAAGVAGFGRRRAGEAVDEEGVECAGDHFATLGAAARVGVAVEQQPELAARVVRREPQPRVARDLERVRFELGGAFPP